MRAAVLGAWLACLGLAQAQEHARSVSMSGSLGDKALLVIDGQPRTVATGATVQGVKLVRVANGEAIVEVDNQRRTLTLGGTVDLGGSGAPSGGGSKIVLHMGLGGHYWAEGTINGTTARFLVDTGATSIAMSQADATRLRIDWRNAPRQIGNTANGQIVASRVKLAAVRIGDVTVYDVDASVLPGQMEFILLGNSFLSHFQMRQENDVMTLTKRF